MPFVCSKTIELGEELVGSYLHGSSPQPHNRLESDKNAATRRILYIKVEGIVCLLDRSDFEPGQNFYAAQVGIYSTRTKAERAAAEKLEQLGINSAQTFIESTSNITFRQQAEIWLKSL